MLAFLYSVKDIFIVMKENLTVSKQFNDNQKVINDISDIFIVIKGNVIVSKQFHVNQ